MYVTQASTWKGQVGHAAARRHRMIRVDGKVSRENLMDRALESCIAEIRRVTAVAGVPVHDADHLTPKSLAFVHDDMHFNAKVAMMVASLVAEFAGNEKPVSERP